MFNPPTKQQDYDKELVQNIYEFLSTSVGIESDALWADAWRVYFDYQQQEKITTADFNAFKKNLKQTFSFSDWDLEQAATFADLVDLLPSNQFAYNEVEADLLAIYGQRYNEFLKTNIGALFHNAVDEYDGDEADQIQGIIDDYEDKLNHQDCNGSELLLEIYTEWPEWERFETFRDIIGHYKTNLLEDKSKQYFLEPIKNKQNNNGR